MIVAGLLGDANKPGRADFFTSSRDLSRVKGDFFLSLIILRLDLLPMPSRGRPFDIWALRVLGQALLLLFLA